MWLLLGLAVCFCCCGGLFAWIPITLRSQRHVVELHGQIQPGMPIADVMTRIDAMPRGSYGVRGIIARPRADAEPASPPDDTPSGCPSGEFMAWRAPGRASDPKGIREQLSRCDAIDLDFIAGPNRFEFSIGLRDGQVATVGPLERSLD